MQHAAYGRYFRERSERVQLLVLERVDPARNMARYCVLSVEPTLFGDTALVREWGRIGMLGRRRLDLYAKECEARISLSEWFSRKVNGATVSGATLNSS